MKMQGSVKVEAVVAPDGCAKAVAIKAAPKETHELIEVKFNP
jgi:hypothetical protein